MRGFLIGNGTSREHYDLHKLDGVTVGCNRLYHTFEPDYLVGIDTEMRIEISEYIRANRPRKWKWITREYLGRVCSITVDGEHVVARHKLNGGYNNNSGIMGAAFLAECLHVDTCYLIGVDFFRPVPGRDNDLTGGNYPQICMPVWHKLIERNPGTEFVRVGPIADYDKAFYASQCSGFTLIDYDDLRF